MPVAFVVCRTGSEATEAELRDHCLARLARFKVPRAIEFVETLPRNPSGNVLKRLLRGQPPG